MSVLDKVKTIFSRKKTSSASGATIMVNSGLGQTKWTPKDYGNFCKESYMKNAIAFRCIDIIAKSVGSVPFKLFQRINEDEREEVLNHPVNKLLRRPNPDDSWDFLMIQYIAYLLVSGNSFFVKIAPSGGVNAGMPKELYILRPDKMKIHTNQQNKIDGYIYNNDKFYPVDPIKRTCDCLQIKLFHPLDDYWGMSITEPASREIDSSNEATEWQMKVMQNEGRPGLIITVQGSLNAEQYDRLEQKLKDLYSGAKNAGRSLILESDIQTDAKPYSWSPKEMDWIDSNREMARKMCLAYGAPPMILGIPGDNTYSNYQEARAAFWEETVFFYLDYLKGELNNWMFGEEEKLFIDYILDDVPALAAKRKMQWERAQQSDFLTINEKRELVKYKSVEGGDVILISATMIPLAAAGLDQQSQNQEAVKIQQLIEQGFTEEEAYMLLDLPDLKCEFISEEEKPYPNEYSCRLTDPGKYSSFARKNNAANVNGKPIDFVYGIKSGKSELQSIRYKKKYWEESTARSHCNTKEHILFE